VWIASWGAYLWPLGDEVGQLRRLVDEVLPLVRD
jgi:hypothetical protein